MTQVKQVVLSHSQVVFELKGVTRLTKRVSFELTLNELTGQEDRLEPDLPEKVETQR